MSAKEIVVKPIKSSVANKICKMYHYSGKVVPNSQLHFGVYYKGKLEGVLQFGPSLNKKGTVNLVSDTKFHDFIELNRMSFSDRLPRFSESRAISICHKIIKKRYPNIKWIISFADCTQCGDGAIYRASGYVLTAIKKNTSMWENVVTGERMQDMQFYHTMTKKTKDWKQLSGYMLRYVYFLDKSYRKKLTVPEIPFAKIAELDIGMYKGKYIKRVEHESNASGNQSEESGAIPTDTLQMLGGSDAV
jgi:hypothetical protein